MKILIIADFRDDSLRWLMNNSRKFTKGFLRNGHDVQPFSYRNKLLENSWIPSKKWAVRLAKKTTDQQLARLTRHYQPDLVLITAFKLLDADTVCHVKHAAPHAVVMCWYGDLARGIDPQVAPIARQCHWFLATSAGSTLADYHRLGIEHCAFLPNPSDPDIEHRYPVADQWRTPLMFTGKLRHGLADQDPQRLQLLQTLVEKKQLIVYGDLGNPSVQGLDYYLAICGADIALSINAFNDVPMYHSDRLIHYLGCGAFVLAKHVPDSERLFEDNRHLAYFHSIEHCLELIDRFRADPARRRALADAGMHHAHQEFSCEKLTRHIIDLATGGEFHTPWAQIL